MSVTEAVRPMDEKTIAELFDRERDYFFRIAVRYLSDPYQAEDVVQEAYIRTVARRHSFAGRSALRTWVVRILINLAIDEGRRRRPVPAGMALAVQAGVVDNTDVSRHVLRRESAREIDQVLRTLPEHTRQLFVRHHYLGETVDSLATEFGMRPGTIKSRLHRARIRLRPQMRSLWSELRSI